MNNKIKLICKINSGSFGNIYKIEYNNKNYALKEEKNSDLLKYEINIYKNLREIKNITKIHNIFNINNIYYIMMDLYDYDLNYYKTSNYNNFNYRENVLKILVKSIKILENIHNSGYIHRDIKPGNICLKNNEPYFIDFGISKQYIVNKKHILKKSIQGIIGSNNFISINILNLIEPSRRDDIISLIYIFIFLLLKVNIEYDFIKYKNNINDLNLFCRENNINIEKILFYLNKMTFTQKPNYEYIILLLSEN
jgi:serine/threonine protein kinase